MSVLGQGVKLTLKQIRKKIKNKKKAEAEEIAKAQAKAKKNLSKEEKEAIKYEDSLDARTEAAEQRVRDQGTFFDEEYYNKGGRPKKIKKKSGGRLSDGTAFIKSLYKDKM